jgi:outer membrane protein TolC
MKVRTTIWFSIGVAVLGALASAQNPPPANGPITVTLADALTRARQYGGQIQSANLAVLQAGQDSLQARAARLPSVTAFNQYIHTQQNGAASGVFVANDGVHVYNEQAVVHEELLSYVRNGELRRAMAAEAVARAKVEVAVRGLNGAVIQAYYAIVAAQRRLVNAQTAVTEAQRFFQITQQLERGGEAARADVIKAQIDLQSRQRDVQEAQVNIEKSKINLGVLIFPNVSSEYAVVDDLQDRPLLPPVAEVQSAASASSPDLKAASAGIVQAGHEVTVARYGYLPSLGLDLFYGWNANRLTIHAFREGQERLNVGYVAQATLNIPVWNWGTTRSKIRQAELKKDQAQLDLTLAQRTLQGNLAASYAEARAAEAQLDSLRSSVDLAAESLRLTLLRYQAGEASALEVVDAQNTATASRNAYDDGQARYRVAIVTIQLVMGTL